MLIPLLLELKKLTKSSLFVVYDLHLGKHHTLYFPNEQEVMLIPLESLRNGMFTICQTGFIGTIIQW